LLADLTSASPPLLILEAFPERFELKEQLHKEIEGVYGDRCPIIGSNTSSLSLQALSKTRSSILIGFVVIHYFQPARNISAVVEFSKVEGTDHSTLVPVLQLLKRCHEEVVVLGSPLQGLLINRLQRHAIHREAWDLISRKGCGLGS
jgi:3-hydroxybutyryl-CoA dehydrogenase